MRRRIAVLCLSLLAAACSEAPFVEPHITYTYSNVPVGKDRDQVRQYGYFNICYDDKDADQVAALARETCLEYGLEPRPGQILRNQCRFSAPHRQYFECVDPRRRLTDGKAVNPFDKTQLQKWESEQKGRAKTAKPEILQETRPSAGQLGAPPSPSLAPASPGRNSSAGPAPKPQSGPLPPPAPEEEPFNPPTGGWGQAWDKAETGR